MMRSRPSLVVDQPKAKLPKGVWFQRKLLSSGEVVRYGYYGRGPGSVSLGREGSAEFFGELAAILRREPDGGTVAHLNWRYQQSPEFGKLRPRTKADYIKQLKKVDAAFGKLSLKAMASRSIVPHIFNWRDGMQAAPRQADYGIQALKVLLSWGKKRGLLDHNRAEGIGRLYTADRSECIWTETDIDRFLAVAPKPLQRALLLALETGQRQGDLLKMTWSAIDGKIIRVRQGKGGRWATVPMSRRLEACLAEVDRGSSETILTHSRGKAWTGNGFRAAWQDAARDAAIEGLHFHDLRGTFVTRRFEEGWTAQEIAFCSGHSLRSIGILEKYAHRGLISAASALRLVERREEQERHLQTSLQTDPATKSASA